MNILPARNSPPPPFNVDSIRLRARLVPAKISKQLTKMAEEK
jgi:hypothetical protein